LIIFSYCIGLTMTVAVSMRCSAARARPDQPLEQRHMDLAASIQA